MKTDNTTLIAQSPKLELVALKAASVRLRSERTGITFELEETHDGFQLSLWLPDSYLATLTKESLQKMVFSEMLQHPGISGMELRLHVPLSPVWYGLTKKPHTSRGNG